MRIVKDSITDKELKKLKSVLPLCGACEASGKNSLKRSLHTAHTAARRAMKKFAKDQHYAKNEVFHYGFLQ